MQKTCVLSLGWDDPLEKEMATHSSIPAGKSHGQRSLVGYSPWGHTRLPCPWDSPGKNTGVGCHFLLQCMKVKSESEVVQSCPTPRDPMDCSPPGSSAHGIFQARGLEWEEEEEAYWMIPFV